MIEVREYIPSDYSMIVQWSNDWNYPYLPEDWMPEIGLIVSNNGTDVYAVWLFQTDGAILLLEGLISNKYASREDREGVLESLFEHIREIAKIRNYKVICTIAMTPSLVKKVVELGFMDTPNVSYLSIGV